MKRNLLKYVSIFHREKTLQVIVVIPVTRFPFASIIIECLRREIDVIN